MSKRVSLLAVLGLAASFSPAFAAEVYIPLAAQQKVDGFVYRTEVVVSNPGEETRSFSSSVLSTDSDRAQSAVSAPRSLPAGKTFVLNQPSTVGKQRMLTISADEDLVITARLTTSTRDGRLVSIAPAPVVTSDNLLSAGSTAHVQGIGRGALLGLVNASEEASQCWATAFRADGSQSGEAQITVAARSARLWNEALTALGSSFAEARAEITCDAPFYAYAFVRGADGQASFLSPSGSLTADQDEIDLATGEAVTQTCAAGDAVIQELPNGGEGFHIPGEFLAVRQGDLCRGYDIPLRTGVAYRHITVEFDVHLHRWVTNFFHNVTSLRRSGKKRNERVLFAGMIIRGDNRKTILDLGHESQVKQVTSWQPGFTYRVVLDADVPSRRVILKVFRGDDLMQQMSGRMTTREIKALTDKRVRVDFSSPGIGDGAYFPPTGWRYSNLTVRATR